MFLPIFTVLSCTTTTETKILDSADQNLESNVNEDMEMSGAVVTSNCMYEGYAYAIDILLSCGDERFDEVLRLHTFKQHAWEHSRIFRDQKLTYRDENLWFDDYQTPRCVSIDGNRWFLSTQEASCTQFALDFQEDNSFVIRNAATDQCANSNIGKSLGASPTQSRSSGDHPIFSNITSNPVPFERCGSIR